MHTAQPNRRSSTCVTSQQPALAQHRPSFSSTSNNKFINSALHSLPTGPPSRVLAVPRLSPFAVEPFHPKHRQIKPRDSNNNSKSLAKISSSANMMGVLKVVLPVLGTAQIVLAFLYADPGFQKKMFELLFGGSTKGADAVACKVLMELLCPLFLGMASLNIWSWSMGSAVRPKVAMSNMFPLVGVLVVHNRHSGTFPSNSIPVWVCSIGILAIMVGLVLHQLEPGLLTTDKTKTPKKSKKYT